MIACPFCTLPPERILLTSAHGIVIRDGYDAGIMADQSSMTSVARWGYANAVAGGAQGWIKSAQYEFIDDSYLKAWA